MKDSIKPLVILMADDDEDDRMMTQQAWRENKLANDLRFVPNGEKLMDYLNHHGEYCDPEKAPRPDLILLDLNMPKMDGRQALKQIKTNPELRQIPVVVLTTSKAEEDIYRSYQLGANTFITKPVTFDSMVEITKTLNKYWFVVADVPVTV